MMKPTQLPANMQNKIVMELCPVSGLSGFCWSWTGALNSKGYGCIAVNARSQLSHRVAYQLLVGPIPDGFQIDHLCLNIKCCNPDHLEAVTPKVNVGRTDKARKERCKYGHPLAGPNVRIKPKPGGGSQRQCKVCEIDQNARYTQKARTGARTPSKAWAVRREAKREALIRAGEQALAELRFAS